MEAEGNGLTKKEVQRSKDDHKEELKKSLFTKGLVVELAPPHVQSAWGSRGERVRVAGLVAYCNYFSKKKKIVFLKMERVAKFINERERERALPLKKMNRSHPTKSFSFFSFFFDKKLFFIHWLIFGV